VVLNLVEGAEPLKFDLAFTEPFEVNNFFEA